MIKSSELIRTLQDHEIIEKQLSILQLDDPPRNRIDCNQLSTKVGEDFLSSL